MKSNIEIYQVFPQSGYLMHSYVIKTPNNKIVVIDGGNVRYMDKAYLPFAIRGILGLDENDYFEIEALFISHAHDDHYGEFIMMMREYDEKSNYKVNNFYFDFPDFESGKYSFKDVDKNLDEFKESLQKYALTNKIDTINYYEQLNGAVINSNEIKKGLTITIDGVDFEILQTWDESDDNVNGNSLIFRVCSSDKKSKTCLFLNDASIVSGDRLCNTYGNYLKSDMVQLAHHGQKGVSQKIYQVIDAKVRLWPTPSWVWTKPNYQTGETRSWFNVDMDNVQESDFVGCLYQKYPSDYRSAKEWNECAKYMKVTLD